MGYELSVIQHYNQHLRRSSEQGMMFPFSSILANAQEGPCYLLAEITPAFGA